jgi:hypothetical protein
VFAINLVPVVGTAYDVYELLNGDGGPSDVTDSIGSTAEAGASAAEASAAANRSSAAALRGAGMYNRRQRVFNSLADADRDVGNLLSAGAHGLAIASFVLNVYEYQKAYNECSCSQ